MKHTIKTNAGAISIEPTSTYQGQVLIKVKPAIWPEVLLTIKPEEAELISQALYLVASEVLTRRAPVGVAA
ncbi:hypothetical protein HUU62_04305 [Rhodoferax sp. 4810]|nr:hypothetical protein [Rhodoferax jenense]